MPPEISAGACPCAGPMATEMSHIAVATATAPRTRTIQFSRLTNVAPAQPSQRLARECRYRRRITQDACASSAEMQARYRRIPPDRVDPSLDLGRQQIKRHGENQIHGHDKHPDEPRRSAGIADQGRGHGRDQYHCHGARPEL